MKYTFKERFMLPFYDLAYIYRAKIRRKSQKYLKKININIPPIKNAFGRELISRNATQDKIYNLIMSGRPIMISRMGGVESTVVPDAIRVEMQGFGNIRKVYANRAHINAGFFPATNEKLIKFSHLIQNSFKQVDLLGTMFINNDDFLIRNRLSKDVPVTHLENFEPYYSKNPWTRALKGKKVLVIHPFAKTIASQYEKRDKLFENPDILPEFELKTLKAVQSIAGTKTEFEDWFQALDYMVEEALKIDFDVAIIGCGAYGFPLAAKLKAAGKQAIHLAGATQILFGIWGSRWDRVPEVKCLKNEYWVRPAKEETPTDAKKVEGACYW